jgi:hypothetical protein
MTKSTPTLTLTQSGLLAVLLQRQRYAVIELARRRAHRQHMRAAFWSALARAHGTKAHRQFGRARCGNPPAAHLNPSPSQLPCITRSTPTLSSRNRFTTICGSNILTGLTLMAAPPCAIRTSRASRNCSAVCREADPTSLSLLLIAFSNRALGHADV